MEKHFQKLRIRTVFFALLLICINLNAQTPSVLKKIRFPIWAEVDAYPGLILADSNSKKEETKKEKQNEKLEEINADKSVDENNFESENKIPEFSEQYSYAIGRIKEIVPFLMNGLVYGWEFVYVPSDKSRNVEEYFEIKEIQDVEKSENKVVYSSAWIEDNKLYCWVDYERTDHQIQLYNYWASINNPAIQGRGYGDIEKGFDGIKQACEDALKNAVREHYRKIVKNKPKEITGKVLIRKEPVIGINQGRYVINLDFFLEYGKIKEYSQF